MRAFIVGAIFLMPVVAHATTLDGYNTSAVMGSAARMYSTGEPYGFTYNEVALYNRNGSSLEVSGLDDYNTPCTLDLGAPSGRTIIGQAATNTGSQYVVVPAWVNPGGGETEIWYQALSRAAYPADECTASRWSGWYRVPPASGAGYWIDSTPSVAMLDSGVGRIGPFVAARAGSRIIMNFWSDYTGTWSGWAASPPPASGESFLSLPTLSASMAGPSATNLTVGVLASTSSPGVDTFLMSSFSRTSGSFSAWWPMLPPLNGDGTTVPVTTPLAMSVMDSSGKVFAAFGSNHDIWWRTLTFNSGGSLTASTPWAMFTVNGLGTDFASLPTFGHDWNGAFFMLDRPFNSSTSVFESFADQYLFNTSTGTFGSAGGWAGTFPG